jgi:thioredoxin reductase/ferredoxin
MSVALYVPLMLLAVAFAMMAGSHVVRQARERRRAAEKANAPAPRILIHSINDDRCTGCDACVAVCPTDVLELVNNKSRVLRFGDCIQCEQCMFACPTQALVMHWDDGEPPPLKVPHLDPFYQTGVQGMYLIGEVAGKPLVKNAANIGRAVVEHMIREGLRTGRNQRRRAEGSDAKNVTIVDVAIVGSGPGGLSAALTCMHHGLSYVVLEKEQVVASTVSRYPKGKDVMAEPYDVRNVSFLPVYDATKEQLVADWQGMIKESGLEIRMGEAVEQVAAEGDGLFSVRTTVAAYRAQRVVLATGTRGKPRTLGVPGENLPKVSSMLDDPDLYRGKDVLVVGGGDSAVEAACALADAGARVLLSYRGKQFNRAQAKNRETVSKYAKAGKVGVHLGSQVIGFTGAGVTLQLADNQRREFPNGAAFVLIGADPPVAWLEKLGVQFVERPHWYALGATDQLVESLIGRVTESPRDVRHLVAMVRGQARPVSVAEVRPPVPEPSVMRPLPVKPTERPRTLPGQALDWGEEGVFTSATRIGADGAPVPMAGGPPPPEERKPIPLEEFARRSKEQRAAAQKRKKPRTAEVTRLLRALRDEGARLAHDETGVSAVSLASGDFHSVHTGTSSVELSEVSGVEGLPATDFAGPNEPTVFGPRLEPGRGAPPPAVRPTPAIVEGLPSRPAGGQRMQPPPPSRLPDPDPDLATPPPAPAPKRKGFIEARTTAASPEFIQEMARVRATAPPRGDETMQTDQTAPPPDFEVASRDPDDLDAEEEGWEVVESTTHADPATIERLREQLRRK